MSSHLSNPGLISFWERIGYMLFKVKTELLTHWPHHHRHLTSLYQKYCQSREARKTTQTGWDVTPLRTPAAKGAPHSPTGLALPLLLLLDCPLVSSKPITGGGYLCLTLQMPKRSKFSSPADPCPGP